MDEVALENGYRESGKRPTSFPFQKIEIQSAQNEFPNGLVTLATPAAPKRA